MDGGEGERNKNTQILKAVHRLTEKNPSLSPYMLSLASLVLLKGFVVFLLGISEISKLMLTTCLEPI